MRTRIIACVAGVCALSTSAALEPLDDKLLWLPIGDSITEGEKHMGHEDSGTDSCTVETRGGYRYQVWKALEAGGQHVRTVGFRTGHCGTVEDPATCDWAYHAAQYGGVIVHDNGNNHGAAGFNVENTLAIAGYPDIITVLIGVNDLSFTGKNTTDVEPEYILVYETMREMVSKIARLRPASKVYVVSLLPASGNRNYIVGYNTYLRAQSEANAAPFDLANVELMDINREVFNEEFNSSYFKSDVLHPNETGSILVAGGFTNHMWNAIADIKSAALQPIAIDNATAGKVRVLFNKALATDATATLKLIPVAGGEAVSFSDPTIDGRSFLFEASSLTPGDYTAEVTVGGATMTLDSKFVQIHGTGAEENVPAALRENMVKYQTYLIGTNDNWAGSLPSEGLTTETLDFKKIDRVGYYLELKRPGKPAQFAWASFDAEDPFLKKLARCTLPTKSTGSVKSLVTNLQVYATHLIATNANEVGVIEFTPYDWSGTDQSGFPQDLFSGKFGWNDTLGSSTLKGCLQIARSRGVSSPDTYTNVAAELVFAFNNFNTDDATDAGIGSFSTHRADTSSNSSTACLDWTDFNKQTQFKDFAMSAYEVRKLEIWVQKSADQSSDPIVTDHLTSSYGGGQWIFLDDDADVPFVYTTGSATAATMTLQILAALPKKSGTVVGWLENAIPVQLVYNSETDLFDVTWYDSSSLSSTVKSTPQDVTQLHLYTICVTSAATPGVQVYQDGNLIVNAPDVRFGNTKISTLIRIGDRLKPNSTDITSLYNPLTGMTVLAVDIYYPKAELDTTRAFATFGGIPSDASLSQRLYSVAHACDSEGLISFAPVTINGVEKQSDEAADIHYMFNSSDATAETNYTFSLSAPTFTDGGLTLALGADDPVNAYLTLEKCDDLSEGAWTTVEEIAPGSATRTFTVTDDVGATGFFRASASRSSAN